MGKPYVYEYRIRRVRRIAASEVSTVNDPATAAAVFWPFVRELAQETFLVALLGARNELLGIERVFTGTMTAVDVHPREVFRAAILAGAASIVVAHNHPSGDTEPSNVDIVLTHRLKECGEMLGVPVLDHVVLGERPGDYTSLVERGVLQV